MLLGFLRQGNARPLEASDSAGARLIGRGARMTKADVWMPLYIGDYLADTARLTTEQHGAYLLLMMDYWRNGAPPDDDEILRNIVRLSKFLWKKHRTVLEKFFTVKDGRWTHKRIDEEMVSAGASKAKASEQSIAR
jgi:uncharacterized protein YdaU (DUF1376 family)